MMFARIGMENFMMSTSMRLYNKIVVLWESNNLYIVVIYI